MGWWWHPAGNAWLCNTLWEHYEFTCSSSYLAKIYPLLKGACEFWEARLVTTTVTDPDTGAEAEVLIADSDWSPEHGPLDAKGITYAQELVWALFANYRTASEVLKRDTAHADEIASLQKPTLRSPYDHERILPFFDGGDHLHPNDKGMQAMADSVDVDALRAC